MQSRRTRLFWNLATANTRVVKREVIIVANDELQTVELSSTGLSEYILDIPENTNVSVHTRVTYDDDTVKDSVTHSFLVPDVPDEEELTADTGLGHEFIGEPVETDEEEPT